MFFFIRHLLWHLALLLFILLFLLSFLFGLLLDLLSQLEEHIGPVDIKLGLHVLFGRVLLILLPFLFLVIKVGIVVSFLEISLVIVLLVLPCILVGAL